jgi:hypothetical protein
MLWLSMSEVAGVEHERVGTRMSGLNGAIFSASPNTDHGRCSNAMPYSVSAMPTRRTKGESYWPMRIMGLRLEIDATQTIAQSVNRHARRYTRTQSINQL